MEALAICRVRPGAYPTDGMKYQHLYDSETFKSTFMTNLFPKFSAKVMTVILTCHLFPASIFSQPSGVGIGTTTVEQSAILDVTSTDKGVLVPRLTTAQRIGVLTPAAGLLVYYSDYKSFWYFDGNSWDELTKETNNTDEQTLSFNSPDLSISNGNTVDLLSLIHI